MSALTTFICDMLGWLLSGVTISYLWKWYLVPVFPEVPQISVIQAMGLDILFGMFLPTNWSAIWAKEKNEAVYLTVFIVRPLFALATGYVLSFAL